MAIKKRKVSPRQKMINLMYVVLMAMLALNVSSDVLNGFKLIGERLKSSTDNSSLQNKAIYNTLSDAMKQNPEKTRQWYEKAQAVKVISDSLYDYAEQLKKKIAVEADGKNANPYYLRNKENTEATTHVMLAPGVGQGRKLYNAINSYREKVLAMVTDTVQRRIISNSLSTEVTRAARLQGKNWQEYMFESTPTIAAITLLTKLQGDVRYAEGEVLHTLVSNIDIKDVRVNQINAYVIPSARTVVRGGRFSAQIIMAAVDTTQRPDIYVGNTLLKSSNGTYETVCNSTGDFTLKGYLMMRNGDGEEIRREFSQPYTVVEPSATVSATMMNMLYAGYQNPIAVSVPGVPTSSISLSMSGGSLTQTKPGEYVAVPSKVGEDVVFTVMATLEGRSQEMGKFPFHVRKLPDPMPYIDVTGADGNTDRYRGGKPVSKAALLKAPAIGAAIDDGLLNINFKVLSFETTFHDRLGNVIPEVSQSTNFSERQKAQMRQLTRGARFYITRVHAVGPDGIERTLPSAMEVIVN